MPEEEQKEVDLSAEAEAARTKDNLKNYASVTDNPEEAFIELDRYVKEGFAVKLSMEEAVRRYGMGNRLQAGGGSS